jgi:hypothetical protein
MEGLFPLVLDLMSELFLLVATIGISFVIVYVKKRTTSEQRRIIEIIVTEGVLFAQQMYGHLQGQERYNKAIEMITLVLREKGLKTTEQELKLMIEATLKRLKAEFGAQW